MRESLFHDAATTEVPAFARTTPCKLASKVSRESPAFPALSSFFQPIYPCGFRQSYSPLISPATDGTGLTDGAGGQVGAGAVPLRGLGLAPGGRTSRARHSLRNPAAAGRSCVPKNNHGRV